MIPIQFKAAVAGIALIIAMSVGWMTRGWYEADKAQAANKAKAKAEAAALKREAEIAKAVEDQLSKVNESRGVVYREVTKIIRQPIYSADCLDADGLRVINKAAGHPAESTDKVPKPPKASKH